VVTLMIICCNVCVCGFFFFQSSNSIMNDEAELFIVRPHLTVHQLQQLEVMLCV
jgi:hypothetical protein